MLAGGKLLLGTSADTVTPPLSNSYISYNVFSLNQRFIRFYQATRSTRLGQMTSMLCLPAFACPNTWSLEPEVSTFAENSSWTNKDMDPVPVHKQTWTTLNYVTFWISCSVNATVWQLGSSMLAIGLSWYKLQVAVCFSLFLIDSL
jgi:cytosine/uracil/thiamine/allantoin permease